MYLWSDVVPTATFLVNCRWCYPTGVLSGAIPVRSMVLSQSCNLYPMQNYSPYLHGCLGALPLSKIILQGYQSWLLLHLRWSSWATRGIKKVILCIFLPYDVMSHLQMSVFMRMFPYSLHLPLFLPPYPPLPMHPWTHSSFPSPHRLNPNPLLPPCQHLALPRYQSPPPLLPPSLPQLFYLMYPSLPLLILFPHSLILTFLLPFERAHIIIPNIRSVIMSCLSVSPHPIGSLLSPSYLGQFPRHILKHCRYWMQNMPHFFNERCGSWYLAHRMLMLSPASGCTPSSKILMALLLDTRRVWWLMVSPKHMASATLRPSLLWLALAPLVSFALLLSIKHGLFTNSTSPMPFFMVTWRNMSIWRYLLGMLLRGSLLWYVCSIRQSID